MGAADPSGGDRKRSPATTQTSEEMLGARDSIAPTDRRIVERVPGLRPGDAIVRVRRPKFEGFSRTAEGHLEAGLELERPSGPLGSLWRILVGTTIHSELERHERLSKLNALAVFSS